MRKGRMTQEKLDVINQLYNEHGCNNTVIADLLGFDKSYIAQITRNNIKTLEELHLANVARLAAYSKQPEPEPEPVPVPEPEQVPEQVPETLNREAIGKALAAVAVAVMALADAINGKWEA